MTTDAIHESGMVFGPYPAGQCFYIEKSKCYEKVNPGVQMSEFLLLRTHPQKLATVWVVEAKSSSPRPNDPNNPHKFEDYIQEISEKLRNAFMLGMAACLKRHSEAAGELSEAFKNIDLAKTPFRLALVIRGHEESWLVPLQEALQQALKPFARIWALGSTPVTVMNEVIAKQHGLILSNH